MSYLNGKYISPVGSDFTDFVNTEEDYNKFQRISELETSTIGVPAKDCMDAVVEALNLGRELQGIKARVNHIKGPSNPQLN